MIPSTYEQIWMNTTPKDYARHLSDATAAITALWQRQKKGHQAEPFLAGGILMRIY